MAANNETGVLAPLAEIGRIASSVGAYFHTDATQMVGKLPIDMREVGASLLSLSAHKFYGPKGVGALSWTGACGWSPCSRVVDRSEATAAGRSTWPTASALAPQQLWRQTGLMLEGSAWLSSATSSRRN